MRAEELVKIIDKAISEERADGLLEKIKIENYHAGKLEGYLDLKKMIVEAINSDAEKNAPKEMPIATESNAEKTTTKKK